MWLPQDYGRGPGEIQAAYSVPVHQPHVTPLRNQWLDAIKQIAPQIADYIQRKKSDEIANQLLQLEHAPAELQGKGQLGLHGAQLFQQYQQDQQANTPDTWTDNLNAEILQRKAHPEWYPDDPALVQRQRHYDLMQQRENRLGIDKTGTENTLGMGAQAFEGALRSGGIQKTTDVEGKTHVTVTPKGGLPVEVKENDLNKSVNRFREHMGKYEPDQSPQLQPAPAKTGSVQPVGMSKEQYDAMPSGTVYTAPDGSRRVKK